MGATEPCVTITKSNHIATSNPPSRDPLDQGGRGFKADPLAGRQLVPVGLDLPAQAFVASLSPVPAVHELITRHQHLLILQLTQSVLCAKVHSLQQRLCRWVLTLHDRTENRKLDVTQQFLSELLNTSRPLLTATAGVLANAGLILQHRGGITIIDDRELARLACPCYRIIGEALKTFRAC